MSYLELFVGSGNGQGGGDTVNNYYQGMDSYKTIAEIEALSPANGDAAYLANGGRSGVFVFDSSNLSSMVSIDTLQGVYIAPSSDDTGASGAWVRRHSGFIHVDYFGAMGGGADDSAAFNACVAVTQALGISKNHCEGGKEYYINNVRLLSNCYFVGDFGKNGSDNKTVIKGFNDSDRCFYQFNDGDYNFNLGLIGLKVSNCTYAFHTNKTFNMLHENCDLTGSSAGFYVAYLSERGSSINTQYNGLGTGYGFYVANNGDTAFNYIDKWTFEHPRFSGINGVRIDTARVCNALTFNTPVFNGCKESAFVNVGYMQQLIMMSPVGEVNTIKNNKIALYKTLTSSLSSGSTVINVGSFDASLVAIGHQIVISNAGINTGPHETTVASFDAVAGTITLNDATASTVGAGVQVACALELFNEFELGSSFDAQFIGGYLGVQGQLTAIKWAVNGGFRTSFIGTTSDRPVNDTSGNNIFISSDYLNVERKTDLSKHNGHRYFKSPSKDGLTPANIPAQNNGKGLDLFLQGSGANNLTAPYGSFYVRTADPNKKKIFGVDGDQYSIGPERNNEITGGRNAIRYKDIYSYNYHCGSSTVNADWITGTGSPEGVVTAGVGSFYSRTDGGAGTSFYVKESGTGNTGWVAK